MSRTMKLVLVLGILLAVLRYYVSSPTSTDKAAASSVAATQAAASKTGAEETPSQEAATSCQEYYNVVYGDTLGTIAAHYGTTTTELQDINSISDPDLIHVGLSLCIPGIKGPANAKTGSTEPQTQVVSAESQEDSSANCSYYSVRAGDTLMNIARHYGLSLAVLEKSNRLVNPDLIRPNQTLCIPETTVSNSEPELVSASNTGNSDTEQGQTETNASTSSTEVVAGNKEIGVAAAPDIVATGSKTGAFSWPVRVDTILCSDESAHRARGSINAWDFCVPKGTLIYASAGGTVTYAGCNNAGGYGCWVSINHRGGFSTYYCHMIEGSIRVKAGENVDKNTVLGKVGWTGMTSYGPHTHFEIRLNSVPLILSKYLIKPLRLCHNCNYSPAN